MALPTDDSLEEKKIQAKTCLCEKTLCSMLPPTNWIAVWLLGFVTPWTVACQAPLSMGFSRQIYWSGLPFPSPGDHPGPGIEPRSPALQADFFTIWAMRESLYIYIFFSIMVYHKILNIGPCCLSILYSQSIPPPPSSLPTSYINLDNPVSNRPLCPLQSLETNLFDSHWYNVHINLTFLETIPPTHTLVFFEKHRLQSRSPGFECRLCQLWHWFIGKPQTTVFPLCAISAIILQ